MNPTLRASRLIAGVTEPTASSTNLPTRTAIATAVVIFRIRDEFTHPATERVVAGLEPILVLTAGQTASLAEGLPRLQIRLTLAILAHSLGIPFCWASSTER